MAEAGNNPLILVIKKGFNYFEKVTIYCIFCEFVQTIFMQNSAKPRKMQLTCKQESAPKAVEILCVIVKSITYSYKLLQAGLIRLGFDFFFFNWTVPI